MTGAQVKVLVAGLVAMTVVGVALFGGFLPGFRPSSSAPSTLTIRGQSYYYTDFAPRLPNLLENTSAPAATTFHNVTFVVWFIDWDWVSGARVQGNGTEPNGTEFSFILGSTPAHQSNTTLFLSPDLEFGAYWPGLAQAGDSVQLLVRA